MDEVEDMGNIIKSEFLKLKRYYVVKAGIIMTVLSPLLTLFYSTANDGQTWTFDYFMQQVMISNCTLFFPIIITLIAGYIITREYTDDTMKNTILNYLLTNNDAFLTQPFGLNAGTLLPGPLAFRWTFQFYDYGSISEELAELLERISPYFLNDIQVFGVAFAEAAVFLALIAMVYRRREI